MPEVECTVTDLSRMISGVISDHIDKDLKVTCEISSINGSGTSKWVNIHDGKGSMITAAFWKCSEFPFSEGDKVVIYGHLRYYAGRGYVNLIGKKIEKLGIGDVHKQYQKNYKYLERNGYFEKSQKNAPLPKKIDSIGVLTAAKGDALQDFLFVLRENGYKGKIFVRNCNVQGVNCPNSIISGLDYFEKKENRVDLILMTRGGGSYEDLMGFSDMEVMKKLFDCKTYTISAIGHQNDTMLSDMVADHRSPTPSLAGKDICEKYNEVPSLVNSTMADVIRKFNDTSSYVSMMLYELDSMLVKLPDAMAEIEKEMGVIQNISEMCYVSIKTQIKNMMSSWESLEGSIQELNHDSILEKGYCMLVTKKKGKIVDTLEKLEKYKILKLILHGKEVYVKISILSPASTNKK